MKTFLFTYVLIHLFFCSYYFLNTIMTILGFLDVTVKGLSGSFSAAGLCNKSMIGHRGPLGFRF